MNRYKLILLISFCFMSFGFRLLYQITWSIDSSNPTLWVKFCDRNWSFTDFDFPKSDVLYGTGPTVDEAIQSVFDDINSISSSYIRLALYPPDPDNPPSPQPGDSTFTKESARERTIEVCFKDGGAFSGGHAIPERKNRRYVGCSITIRERTRYNAAYFIDVLGHELGHCLGLDHPQETTHSIMSYFADPSHSIRYRVDDKMGLTFLYRVPGDGLSNSEKSTLGLRCSYGQ